MAEYAYNLYCKDAKIIDFQKISFPICDGNKCYDHPIVEELKSDIKNSSSILIASPIYNYDLNAVSKISGLRILSCPEYAKNNHWLNILNIDEKIYHKSKKKLIKEFLDNNIQVRPIWHLNHLQKPYKTCQSFKIIFAQKLVKNCICLPSSFSLTKKEQSEIIKIMESKNGLG